MSGSISEYLHDPKWLRKHVFVAAVLMYIVKCLWATYIVEMSTIKYVGCPYGMGQSIVLLCYNLTYQLC